MATIFNLLLCYVLLGSWELSSATRSGDMISVNNGERWGKWGSVEYCAEGEYAAGFAQKIEDLQSGGDDTKLNSIELKCKNRAGKYGKSITSAQSIWGGWSDKVWCRNGHFLTGFRLKVDSHKSAESFDDTAVNLIQFKCRDLESTVSEYSKGLPNERFHISWGKYGYWSESCKKGNAISFERPRLS